MSGMEILLGGLSALGGIFQAAGAIQQGQAEANAAKFNARAAEQQARAEREAAAAEASDFKRMEKRKISAARAARGATGVTMAGSPLLVDDATIREVALGAARLGHAGWTKATGLMNESKLYKMRGKAAKTASYFQAGTSLLGTMGQIYGA